VFTSSYSTGGKVLGRAYAGLCRLLLILAVGLIALTAVLLVIRGTLFALLVAAVVFWRRLGRWQGSTHGTAEICSIFEMGKAGLLGNDDGFILGRVGGQTKLSKAEAIRALFSPSMPSDRACGVFLAAFFRSRAMSNEILRVRDAVHLATFSRSGGGKGVSCVLPTLLSQPGSVVVLDPKSENFQQTAAFRRDRLGHTIVRLDPALLGGPGANAFNPLMFIKSEAPDFFDQCMDLADMIVVSKGTETDPHWDQKAREVIAGITAFVCAAEHRETQRNLVLVRDILSSPTAFDRAVTTMLRVNHPTVRLMGDKLSGLVDKEKASVMSTVSRHIAWMSSEAVAACLSGNDIDPRELRRGKVSVYFVVPAERMTTWAGLMRLWLGSFLRLLMRDGANDRVKVLFLLDEIAQLGRMQVLEDATSIARGFGITLWYIFQSLKQVEACYGEKAAVILDNISTMQFFALGNALETAEMIARRIGDETIRFSTPTQGVSFGSTSTPGQMGSSNHTVNYGTNTSQVGRKLLFPDEILRLPEDIALIFHKNLPVVMARLIRYYNAPEFRSGRMGKQRHLGPGALLLSAFTVSASFVLASWALAPPSLGIQGTPPSYLANPWQQGQAFPPWYTGTPPTQGMGGFPRPYDPSLSPYVIPTGRPGEVFYWYPEPARNQQWTQNPRAKNR
jgi:type IV secretion system protein VirD4